MRRKGSFVLVLAVAMGWGGLAHGGDVKSEEIIRNLLSPSPERMAAPPAGKPLTRSFTTRGIDIHQKLEIDGMPRTEAENGSGNVVVGVEARTDGGQRQNLEINFERGSAVLSPSARSQLSELGRALANPQLKEKRIRIGGHTDATGSYDFNIGLSQARANAVRDYLLVHYGLDKSRFDTVGYGEAEPLDPRNPLAAANRRVEIVNLGE